MFERFTEPGIKVVVTSQEEARKIGNNFVGTEQILIGLIAETSGIGGRILRKYGITLRLVREEITRLIGRGSGFVAVEIPFTPRARRVLENAIKQSKYLGFPYVGPEHILLGILMEDSGIAVSAMKKVIEEVNPKLTFDGIRKRCLREMGEDFAQEFGKPSETMIKETNAPINSVTSDNFDDEEALLEAAWYDLGEIHPYFDPESPLLLSPVINEYTQNITQAAFAGEIDPVIGRDSEVERVLQILSRRRKNNPILLGEPGVGKTAVAEGLAIEIIRGQVPLTVMGKNIITLDLGLIIAGSRYRGDFEKRLKRVIGDIQMTECYILVIDEVHTLVGAGAAEGSLDAANILKPSLARGEFQCIGATTLSEYRKYIEPDAALARRFQSVFVNEPTVDDTINILVGIRDRYEAHHEVQITQNALEEAVVLTSRYVNDRFLPDKAIDVLDEACSRVRLGYELIPTACTEFEDQLAALCREKDLCYEDKDWTTGLYLLREEIKFVQQFIRFLYDAIDQLRQEKKIWIIRGLQQRYQFILRGIGPILKEWEIVLALYDNDSIIQSLALKKANLEGKEDDELENLPTPEDPELIENQLLEFRSARTKEVPQTFVNKPPLDTAGNPMEYDTSVTNKQSDPEFDEMNPFADQELDNIQREIENMEDTDGIEELQKKFDNRLERLDPDKLNVKAKYIDKPDDISEDEWNFEEDRPKYKSKEWYKNDKLPTVKDDKLPKVKKDKSLTVKKPTPITTLKEAKELEKKDKKKFAEWEYDANELQYISPSSAPFLKEAIESAGAYELRKRFEWFKIPFDKENIPIEVAEAMQKKLFTDLFTPYQTFIEKGPARHDLKAFEQETKKIYEVLKVKPLKIKDSQLPLIPKYKRETTFIRHQKLWILLSFLVWNKFLLNRNSKRKKGVRIKRSNKKNKKKTKNSKIKEIDLSVGKNQIAFLTLSLYKKEGLLINLKKVDLNIPFDWRNLFHDSLLDRLGNMLIKRFGTNAYRKSRPKAQEYILPENPKKVLPPELSNEAKEFIKANPNWAEIEPKNYKKVKWNRPKKSKEEANKKDAILGNNPNNKIVSNPNPESKDELTAEIEKNEKIFRENREYLERTSQRILSNHKTYIPWVFASDIAGVVSEWTGIPVAKVSKDETAKLLNIEQELQEKVIGQPDAVGAIAKALRRGRVGLRDLERPIASFFFSGPTGVGKTEVTKALAAAYFGGEADMVRFDMSEFMERHTVSKLIGSPPGYIGYNEGGQLTEAVRRKPYIVVLFDEVEKAHPDVFNLLLQVLEDGRLSDSQGRVIDFKNTIIVMTSNLGAAAIQDPDKFTAAKNKKQNSDPNKLDFDDITVEGDEQEKTEDDLVKDLVLEELKGFFRPEFLNRIDEIVVFRKLTKPDIKQIASIMLKNLKERLKSKSYNLLLSDEVIDQILEEGYNPDYGARPLRRVITNRLEDKLAATILEQDIERGSSIWITYKQEEYLTFHKNFTGTEDQMEYFLNQLKKKEEIIKLDNNLENDNLENDNLENDNLENDNLENNNLENNNLENNNLQEKDISKLNPLAKATIE